VAGSSPCRHEFEVLRRALRLGDDFGWGFWAGRFPDEAEVELEATDLSGEGIVEVTLSASSPAVSAVTPAERRRWSRRSSA